SVSIDDSHFAAETAHCLCEFQANVAASQNKEMLRDAIQIESFNVCQGLRFREPSNIWNRRAGTNANDYFAPAYDACSSIRKGNRECFGSNKPRAPHDQLHPACFEVGKMHIH